MSTLVNSAGQPLNQGGAVTQPDQAYFNDLNQEVSDKGFLVTST